MPIFPFKLPTNDKKDTPLTASCPSIVLTNTTNTFLNDFVNNFGANSSLSRELSMAPHTTICLGCNKSFRHISLHWNQKPVCCSSHQQPSAAACHPVLSHGRHSHDFGSNGSSSETGSSGSESCLSPTNLDENGLLGTIIFIHHNDAAHGSSPLSSMAAKGMLHRETILPGRWISCQHPSLSKDPEKVGFKVPVDGPTFPTSIG
jgi:hypothetical protein